MSSRKPKTASSKTLKANEIQKSVSFLENPSPSQALLDYDSDSHFSYNLPAVSSSKNRPKTKSSKKEPKFSEIEAPKLKSKSLSYTNNNNWEPPPPTSATRLDVPNGFLPAAFKNCLLSNAVRSARRSLDHLKAVRESLSAVVAQDEQLSKGVKKTNPSPQILQLSAVAHALTALIREGFVPAHRLNQTALALYVAEDFLRYPKELRSFDAISAGRVKLPDSAFNKATVQKLAAVVDRATEWYKGSFDGGQFQEIRFRCMTAFEDMYGLALRCQEVFKVFLYTSNREKASLQNFLLSLQSMERSDMLIEVQDLRRCIDELVIFLEKLSWGSFVVYKLSSGNNAMKGPERKISEENADQRKKGKSVKSIVLRKTQAKLKD